MQDTCSSSINLWWHVDLQELKKKEKKKNKFSIKSEREGDFGDLAAASSGHYEDIYDEDFI